LFLINLTAMVRDYAEQGPAAWSAFGIDKEGADYRACKAYGPLYKK
jgi:hypothetical protein